MLGALLDGMNAGGGGGEGAGATGVRRSAVATDGNRNGSNMSTALGTMELCWGDVGFLLTMPRQGLGNSAIASVADDEQHNGRVKPGREDMKRYIILYAATALAMLPLDLIFLGFVAKGFFNSQVGDISVANPSGVTIQAQGRPSRRAASARAAIT